VQRREKDFDLIKKLSCHGAPVLLSSLFRLGLRVEKRKVARLTSSMLGNTLDQILLRQLP